MRLDPALLERIDGARGQQTRTAFVTAAVTAALDDTQRREAQPAATTRGTSPSPGRSPSVRGAQVPGPLNRNDVTPRFKK